MKRTIKLALSASLLLGATSAFATNGDVMIGQGAKSRSMGGVGIAKSFGAESALANPAMINSVENMEFTGAVTYFAPSVAFKSDAASNANPAAPAAVSEDSATAASVIPEIMFAQRLSDSFVYGISINGVAGMGTDYDDTASLTYASGTNGSFGMKTALSILKISVPLAYTNSGFTIGLMPVFQYGTLQMSHMYDTQTGTPTAPIFAKLDNGSSSDTGFGFEVGLAYDVAAVKGLSLAAVYKSAIAMEYANTISSSVAVFGGANATGIASGDKLDQPAEIGAGVSYEISGNTIALDVKQIQWSAAAGYGDFGWEDQTVYALGYEYAAKSWAVRLGYNYGANPIAEQTSTTNPYGSAVQNFFNLSGFPGVVESHMTLGGGYNISDALSLDGSFVYAPEVTNSYDTTGMTSAFSGGLSTATSTADVTHSQMGLTLAMTYKF